jgi:tRNA(Ile)-lysidine synthase
MIQKFISYISSEKLIEEHDFVLLSVSGGKDSMVMAHLFRLAEIKHAVAHINHNTRGEASDGDEKFVRDYCELYSIPFHALTFDKEVSKSSNFQAISRTMRYDWLNEITIKYGYTLIATAHHQDDNIESFLMNLLRSSGMKGLSGIASQKGNVIRPLLFTTRREIDSFQVTNKIEFREDSSNATNKYLRNRVRHTVLSSLKDLDQNAVNNIDESIRIINESNKLLEYFIDQDQDFVKSSHNDLIFDLSKIRQLPSPVVYLWYKLYPLGFTKSDINDIVYNDRSGAKFISPSHTATIDRHELKVIWNVTIEQSELPYDRLEVTASGTHYLGDGHSLIISEVDHLDFGRQVNVEFLGFDSSPFPLIVRKRKNGDIFKPLGMKGKTQKLKDFIANQKLDIGQKEKVWLVEKEDTICYVIPYRIGEVNKVKSTSKIILKIEYI